MTHTLHRTGSPESLSRDYVLLFMPSKDINHVGSGPKLRRMLEICLENGAIRIGDCRLGNEYYQGSVDKLLEHVEDRAVVHGVFNDPDKVVAALKQLKAEDLGLSVVVSGLFDKVRECCSKSGLTPHTVNNALGRWGRTDRLPPAPDPAQPKPRIKVPAGAMPPGSVAPPQAPPPNPAELLLTVQSLRTL